MRTGCSLTLYSPPQQCPVEEVYYKKWNVLVTDLVIEEVCHKKWKFLVMDLVIEEVYHKKWKVLVMDLATSCPKNVLLFPVEDIPTFKNPVDNSLEALLSLKECFNCSAAM